MSTDDMPIENVRFAVVDRPVCVWAPDLEDTNLRFLRGVDPDFFVYQAQSHQDALVGDDETIARRAALALRLNYGMALEAFFGLLGAIMQAPDCAFGWLNNYKNNELATLVERISSNTPIKTLPPFRPATWKHISSVLLQPLHNDDPERHAIVSDLFARAWTTFARDFLGENEAREYNSLKHSFRVEPSGVAIEFKHEDVTLLRAESKLAHSFPYLKKIPNRKSHYNVSRATSFLEPRVCTAALLILAFSINNIVAFARKRAGDTGDISIRIPTDLRLFDALWAPAAPVKSMTYGGSVIVADKEYWSDEDILAVYDDVEAPEV